MRQSHKTVLLWITLIFAFVVIWQFLNGQRASETHVLFSQFVQEVDQHPEKFKAGAAIQIRKNAESAELRGTYANNENFVTTGIAGDKLLDKLDKAKLSYDVVKENENGFWQQVFVTWLADAGAGRALLRLHAPAAGRRRQGDELRQVEGQAALREPEQGDLRRRRGHRRGQGRGRGDHRLPQGPEEVHPPRRPHPQGRPDDGPAGHRQDAARARHRRRGGRAVLLHLGLGLRRDVRRRRRQPRARPVRAGQEERPLHHLHRRDRRRRPSPRRRPRRRSRRARADAEPAPRRDGRLRVQRRRHPHRRHQPARRARPGAAAPRSLRPPHRRSAPRRQGPRGHPQRAHQEDAARRGRRPRRDRPRHAGLFGRGSGEPGQRGGAAGGARRQGPSSTCTTSRWPRTRSSWAPSAAR